MADAINLSSPIKIWVSFFSVSEESISSTVNNNQNSKAIVSIDSTYIPMHLRSREIHILYLSDEKFYLSLETRDLPALARDIRSISFMYSDH